MRTVLMKYGFLFLLVLVASQTSAQSKKRQYDKIEYRKETTYKGPEDWGGNSPVSMKPQDEPPELSEDLDQGSIDYSDEDIERYRDPKDAGNGMGDRKGEIVQEPEPIDPPEFEEEPEPETTSEPLPSWVSKLFLILLIVGLALFLGNLLLKNRRKSIVQPVERPNIPDNPVELTQSEFERNLEEALRTENFREAIRLYFVAILKELIQHKLILWKKDKTNHAYRRELKGTAFSVDFSKCAKIYDYVWYGQYELNKQSFSPLEQEMKGMLNQLSRANVR